MVAVALSLANTAGYGHESSARDQAIRQAAVVVIRAGCNDDNVQNRIHRSIARTSEKNLKELKKHGALSPELARLGHQQNKLRLRLAKDNDCNARVRQFLMKTKQ